MSTPQQTDEEVIASLGLGSAFLGRPRTRDAAPVIRWTDSDNLNGREAIIEGGPRAGLRVVVNEKSGRYRYPDVVDLTAYAFDPATWTFVYVGQDDAQ